MSLEGGDRNTNIVRRGSYNFHHPILEAGQTPTITVWDPLTILIPVTERGVRVIQARHKCNPTGEASDNLLHLLERIDLSCHRSQPLLWR